jgi:penicillin-binding protein 1B
MRKSETVGGARSTRFWRRLVFWATLVLACAALGLVAYGWYFSTQIEHRFAGRRWRIPSQVFSNITLLYPGRKTRQSDLLEKLRRLGYREVLQEPVHKGELRHSGDVIDLFLNDLDVPSRKRDGFRVEIRFTQTRILSITRQDEVQKLPLLELEPEEVMLFFSPERERRQLVSIDQTPEHLIHAILGAEDSRFYQHHGADLRGIMRAVFTNLRHGEIRQGGSTITQQLAKSYFLTPERTISRKLKELLLAIIMEIKYEKDEILEIYLNEIYLGQKGSASINGVGEASYFYFGKTVSQLSLVESAMIAGLIKAPNRYSPYVDRELSRRRRNAVLQAMQRNGWLSAEEFQTALPLPTKTVGFSVYGKQAPYFMDYLSEQLDVLYSPEALSSLGLSIYTTLDPEVQKAAEEALDRGLRQLEKANTSLYRETPQDKVQGAIVVMEPKTGHVLAMVGGRAYGASQFNRMTQAQRQPGSAFKPIVALSGLDDLTPATMLSNEPRSYKVDGDVWQPENFKPDSGGQVSLRTALAHSLNLATVDMAMRVGLSRIVQTASRFRFSTPVRPYPSLALGALEVVPLELARAYCVFAADGMLPQVLSLKAVVDENGQILERRHMAIERVTSPEKAYLMNSLLRSVVTDGTARNLKDMGITFPVAGKTGTTNGFRDAWFVGYTPHILALVWVGFDNGDSLDATGSTAALPIWADLMRSLPEYTSGAWFSVPDGVVRQTVCSETGDLATSACPEPVEEVFLAEKAPKNVCRIHRPASPLKRLFKGVGDLLKGL